jgi:chlorophyllide a oxygenase
MLTGRSQHRLGCGVSVSSAKNVRARINARRGLHQVRAEADVGMLREDGNALSTSDGGRSIPDLQEEMNALQDQIHEAHFQAHLQEQRIDAALGNLQVLGTEAVTLETILDPETGSAAQKAQMEKTQQQQTKRKNNPLRSTLTWPKELVDFWYPVEFSKNIKGEGVAFDIFNVPLVLSRNAETKQVECLHDRTSPLHTTSANSIHREAYPTREQDGCVWVWIGESEAPEEIPGFTVPPNPFHEEKDFVIHAELVIDVEVEHGLLLENLLDLAHAPFTHTSTFAKGWSIPDMVKFNTSKLLGGNWEPYPIDMSFEPPCMVLSTIGLMKPGQLEEGARASACQNHLHQLHVCLPSSKGTRLLYRMSLDFMDFMLYVPFAKKLWEAMAAQVLGEDLRLVQGQEDRLRRGGDTWSNPVPYDKLAVRYRKWRNSLSNEKDRREAELALKQMSAGEMLAPEDEAIVFEE